MDFQTVEAFCDFYERMQKVFIANLTNKFKRDTMEKEYLRMRRIYPNFPEFTYDRRLSDVQVIVILFAKFSEVYKEAKIVNELI